MVLSGQEGQPAGGKLLPTLWKKIPVPSTNSGLEKGRGK